MIEALRARLSHIPRPLLIGAAVLLPLLALLTICRPPHHGPPPAVLTAVSTTELGLATRDGWTKTVRLAETTRIHQGPKKLTVADLKKGMHVRVLDEPTADGARLARDVDVLPEGPPPGPPPHRGLETLMGLAGFLGVLWFSRRARRS